MSFPKWNGFSKMKPFFQEKTACSIKQVVFLSIHA